MSQVTGRETLLYKREQQQFFFFFSSRRRHTRCSRDWSSDVCSSDLAELAREPLEARSVRLGGADLPGIQRHRECLIEADAREVGIAVAERGQAVARSEERRVGKECRSRWSPDH